MNDLDTIQKLESELEKLAAQKRTSEEKGKKYKEDSEQVRFPYWWCLCFSSVFDLLDLSNAWLWELPSKYTLQGAM